MLVVCSSWLTLILGLFLWGLSRGLGHPPAANGFREALLGQGVDLGTESFRNWSFSWGLSPCQVFLLYQNFSYTFTSSSQLQLSGLISLFSDVSQCDFPWEVWLRGLVGHWSADALAEAKPCSQARCTGWVGPGCQGDLTAPTNHERTNGHNFLGKLGSTCLLHYG